MSSEELSEWIKTSDRMPKNGVPVIAFVASFEGGKHSRRIRAMYTTKGRLEVHPDHADDFGEYDEDKDDYFCPEGWYENNCYEEVHFHVANEVTHWMPLPKEPTDE